MKGTGYDTAMDALTAAVVEIARHAADGDWDEPRPPRLYALARKADLGSLEPDLPPRAKAASGETLIPIEQDPLPEGEPAEVLASIRWPPAVPGCALVTDVRVVHSDDTRQEEQARLSVGVLRASGQEAQYTCCLQRRGDDELIIRTDLADDLVTALLGTLRGRPPEGGESQHEKQR